MTIFMNNQTNLIISRNHDLEDLQFWGTVISKHKNISLIPNTP